MLLAYIIIGSILALISRRYFKRDLRDYYIASGRLGPVLAAGTYAATTYSAFMMIGLVGLTYATGVGALGFELIYLAATILILSTIGVKIWKMSKKKGWIAPSQMIGDLYDSKILAIITSTIYIFAMIPYLSAQILGLRHIFEYGGFREEEALLISSIIVYAWIAIAGMWSVAMTDLYQGLLMITCGFSYLLWTMFYFLPSNGIEINEITEVLLDSNVLGLTSFWSLGVFLAYTIPWAFFAITNPQVVVRLYLHRDYESYRKSVILFFVFGFIYTLIVVIIGLLASVAGRLGIIPRDLPRDGVTPWLLGLMNPFLGSIIAISIVAAAVSTSNSIVLAVSGSVMSLMERKRGLIIARLIDGILVFLAAILATMRIGFIVELSVLTSVLLLPLVPITILGVLWDGCKNNVSKSFAIVSLITGTGLASYYAIILGPRKAFIELILGLPLSLWVLIVSSLIILIGVLINVYKVRHRQSS